MKLIISADIGGTNCRVGLFTLENDDLKLDRAVWLDTCGIEHADAFALAIEKELDMRLETASALVIAVAGPVEENIYGRLSNGELVLDMRKHAERFPGMRIRVINDFTAQAYAVVDRQGAKAVRIAGEKDGAPFAPRAVIGAGTGLGYSAIHWLPNPTGKGHWLPLPSENGWAAFPFIDAGENEFHSFLKKHFKLQYVCGDDVLSGRGLEGLHLFLTGKNLPAPEVGRTCLSSDNETLAWYSRFYARACRGWILATLCTGGLWITGGIATQNPYCVQNDYFTNELYTSAKWEQFLHAVPIYLLEDKNSGLWGGANLGKQLVF